MAIRQHLFNTEESSLTQIRAWLRVSLGPVAGKPEGYQFIQAVDELCSNIVEHADRIAQEEAKSLSIQLQTKVDRIEAQVTYSGDDFDFTTYTSKPVQDLFKTGHKGGLGIRLINTLASQVKYSRINGVNTCHIAKQLV
jgi:serine/threonine-protein kinase RsbW